MFFFYVGCALPLAFCLLFCACPQVVGFCLCFVSCCGVVRSSGWLVFSRALVFWFFIVLWPSAVGSLLWLLCLVFVGFIVLCGPGALGIK